MPITDRQAYDYKRKGHAVIVECAGCGERVWTSHAVYDEGNDEWTCKGCIGAQGGD